MKAEQRRKRAKPKSTNNAASKIVEREPVQASLFDLPG